MSIIQTLNKICYLVEISTLVIKISQFNDFPDSGHFSSIWRHICSAFSTLIVIDTSNLAFLSI